MKKTFLSLIFAITMGVSLYTGTLKTSDKTLDTKATNISLPSGYTSVNGVRFLKGALIDTGYVFSSENFRIKFNYSDSDLFLSFGFNKNNHLLCVNSKGPNKQELFVGDYPSSNITIPSGFYRSSKTLFDLETSNGQATLNFEGNTYSRQIIGTSLIGESFGFGCYNASSMNDWGYFDGVLYDLYIEENGTAVRNYFPCIEESTNKVGFYDIINNTFLTNKGSFGIYDEPTIAVEYHDSSSNVIKPSLNKILYLGSDTDFSQMDGKLIIPDGVVLTGTVPAASITVGTNPLNLTTIFGTIQPGIEYQLTMNNGLFSEKLTLIKSSEIADIHINGTLDYTSLTTSKNNVATGTMKFCDGKYSASTNVTKFKGRGNNFKMNKKNSFNLTLEEAKQLIPGAGSLMKYCLVSTNNPSFDAMGNMVAYKMYQQLSDLGDGVQYRMVNLYYNNQALGFYMLVEKIEISENVVNITKPKMTVEGTNKRIVNSDTSDKTAEEQAILDSGITEFKYCTDSVVETEGGVIIEAGMYYSGAYSGFKTRRGGSWEIKDPEALTLSQISKIAIYTQQLEDSLYSPSGYNSQGKHYSELIDFDSFAYDHLVRSFMRDSDFYNTSNYLYIDGDNNGLKGKMYAGPVWDFDSIGNTAHAEISYRSYSQMYGYTIADGLIRKGDYLSRFYNINKDCFNQILDNLNDNDPNKKDTFYSYYSNYLASRKGDDLLWERDGSSVTNSLTMRDAFIGRVPNWKNIFTSGMSTKSYGVTITNDFESHKLIANNIGYAKGYQWYKVNESDYTCSIIPGATSSSYTYSVSETGKYFVVVDCNKLLWDVESIQSNIIVLGNIEITFDMRGHGDQVPALIITRGGLVTKPTLPFEDGYVFRGWYKEPEFENRFVFATDTPNDDMTLYARWEQSGTPEGTLFEASSLSLKDNTWLNMYTLLIDDDYQDYKFTYSLNNEEMEQPTEQVDIPSSMVKKIDGEYRVSVDLKPYQLADQVTIYMYDLANHLICQKTDSVKAYAWRLFELSGVSETEKDAVKALLRYGASVQRWLHYNENDLADEGLDSLDSGTN